MIRDDLYLSEAAGDLFADTSGHEAPSLPASDDPAELAEPSSIDTQAALQEKIRANTESPLSVGISEETQLHNQQRLPPTIYIPPSAIWQAEAAQPVSVATSPPGDGQATPKKKSAPAESAPPLSRSKDGGNEGPPKDGSPPTSGEDDEEGRPPNEATIRARVEKYTDAYTEQHLAESIAALDHENPRQNSTHIHYGRHCHTVRLPDTDLVAKIPIRNSRIYNEDPPQTVAQWRIEALARTEGIDGYEQPAAYHPEKAIVVTRYAPGKEIENLTTGEITTVSEEQIDRAATAIDKAFDCGVHNDWEGSNCLYQPEGEQSGFTFVDQGIPEDDTSWKTKEGEKIRFMTLLANVAMVQAQNTKDPEHRQAAKDFITARLQPRVQAWQNPDTTHESRSFRSVLRRLDLEHDITTMSDQAAARAAPEAPLPKATNAELTQRIRTYEQNYSLIKMMHHLGAVDLDNPQRHPAYLTQGSEYVVMHASNTETVIKIPRQDDERDYPQLTAQEKGWQRIQALARSQGLPHFEQPIAYSPETGIIATRFIPGARLDQLEVETIARIPQRHITTALETIAEGVRHGIHVDWLSANCIVKEGGRFAFIDQEMLPTQTYMPNQYSAADEGMHFLGTAAEALLTALYEDSDPVTAREEAVEFVQTVLEPQATQLEPHATETACDDFAEIIRLIKQPRH